ncbi:hypothetical protein K450DRAFT_261574 [Umbelopsis ramanniana AG]|uniref:Uncharacterized protein n=1 Tax=Umbelopsis ramanniana AG TaxID=1314678 RepID=A0AAD5E255_UMBRA|nr:uncharacterized protein K450DRAFT_261574 [Umbelopsis ramanniana AG]KAI8575464.1 hypothetical protein K450DRAFT_261574 [Umbelopsis ramanniana AG]
MVRLSLRILYDSSAFQKAAYAVPIALAESYQILSSISVFCHSVFHLLYVKSAMYISPAANDNCNVP